MTRRSRREIEKAVDDLAGETVGDQDVRTRFRAGVTAEFVRFEDDPEPDPDDLPDGYVWERRASDCEHGADFLVATPEGEH